MDLEEEAPPLTPFLYGTKISRVLLSWILISVPGWMVREKEHEDEGNALRLEGEEVATPVLLLLLVEDKPTINRTNAEVQLIVEALADFPPCRLRVLVLVSLGWGFLVLRVFY